MAGTTIEEAEVLLLSGASQGAAISDAEVLLLSGASQGAAINGAEILLLIAPASQRRRQTVVIN